MAEQPKFLCETLSETIDYDVVQPLYRHSCTRLKHRLVFLFGEQPGNQDASNNVSIYRTDICKWFACPPQHCENEIPAGRSSHVALRLSYDEILVHGGFQNIGMVFDDFWVLKVNDRSTEAEVSYTTEWKALKPRGARPSKRFAHGIAKLSGNIYIFGGCSDFDNGMYVIDVKKWYSKKDAGSGSTIEGRAFHCMNVYKDSIYLFGGITNDWKVAVGMWDFNVTSSTWTEVKYSGGIEPVLREAVSVTNGNLIYYIFGDVDSIANQINTFDVDNKKWLEPVGVKNLEKRIHHTATLGSDACIYIYGGKDERNLERSDFFKLSLIPVSDSATTFSTTPSETIIKRQSSILEPIIPQLSTLLTRMPTEIKNQDSAAPSLQDKKSFAKSMSFVLGLDGPDHTEFASDVSNTAPAPENNEANPLLPESVAAKPIPLAQDAFSIQHDTSIANPVEYLAITSKSRESHAYHPVAMNGTNKVSEHFNYLPIDEDHSNFNDRDFKTSYSISRENTPIQNGENTNIGNSIFDGSPPELDVLQSISSFKIDATVKQDKIRSVIDSKYTHEEKVDYEINERELLPKIQNTLLDAGTKSQRDVKVNDIQELLSCVSESNKAMLQVHEEAEKLLLQVIEERVQRQLEATEKAIEIVEEGTKARLQIIEESRQSKSRVLEAENHYFTETITAFLQREGNGVLGCD